MLEFTKFRLIPSDFRRLDMSAGFITCYKQTEQLMDSKYHIRQCIHETKADINNCTEYVHVAYLHNYETLYSNSLNTVYVSYQYVECLEVFGLKSF